jgi:16S rRNA (guanine527-N7)-methyltransferase
MSDDLAAVLAEAQRRGWVGQGPLDDQLRHAGAFAQLLGEGPGVVFDLGSGGGLPALPAALALPGWRWVLIEAQQRRGDHLTSAVRRLGLGDVVDVLHARAEDVGRDGTWRGVGDAVISRSFGPPGVVAECAAPLLRLDGRLLVSEPPQGAERWSSDGLAEVGLGPATALTVDDMAFAELRQVAACPASFPRRPGVPQRAPLF